MFCSSINNDHSDDFCMQITREGKKGATRVGKQKHQDVTNSDWKNVNSNLDKADFSFCSIVFPEHSILYIFIK